MDLGFCFVDSECSTVWALSCRDTELARWRVSTGLRPWGTGWGCEDMLTMQLPLHFKSECGLVTNAVHHGMLTPGSHRPGKKKRESMVD